MPPKLKDPFQDTKNKFKNNDLRTIWKRMKADAFREAQKQLGPKAAKNIEQQFDRGLGPHLDEWAKQAQKLPNVKREKLMEIHDHIVQIIQSYSFEIQHYFKGTNAAIVLPGVLKHIREELDRQVGWYKEVGLW